MLPFLQFLEKCSGAILVVSALLKGDWAFFTYLDVRIFVHASIESSLYVYKIFYVYLKNPCASCTILHRLVSRTIHCSTATLDLVRSLTIRFTATNISCVLDVWFIRAFLFSFIYGDRVEKCCLYHIEASTSFQYFS